MTSQPDNRLRDELEAATTALLGIGALVDEWRADQGSTAVDTSEQPGRDLYRTLGDVRACIEAARQDTALVQRQVQRAGVRLTAILAKPTDDPLYESVALLREDLAYIHQLLAGPHVATAVDSRFIAGDSS